MGSCDRHCICILCLLNVDSLFSASVNWYRVSWKLEYGRVDQCWSRTRFIFSWVSTTGNELCSLLSKMPRKGRKRARSSKTIAKEKFPIGELACSRKVLKEEFISNCKVYSTESSKLKKLKRKARKSKFSHMYYVDKWRLIFAHLLDKWWQCWLYLDRCLLFFTEDIKFGTVKINTKSCDPKCASALLNSASFFSRFCHSIHLRVKNLGSGKFFIRWKNPQWSGVSEKKSNRDWLRKKKKTSEKTKVSNLHIRSQFWRIGSSCCKNSLPKTYKGDHRCL